MTTIETRASNAPWDGSASRFTPEQYKRSCLIDKGTGDPDDKERYALPVLEPDGALNANAVVAAAGRIGQVQVSPDKKQAAAKRLVSLYHQIDKDPPPDLVKLAGGSSDDDDGAAEHRARGVVEERAATVDRVDFGQRILTVLAVPYEQPAPVEYRGEVWREVFSRAAFHGFDPGKPNARSVPVSAKLTLPALDHVNSKLVGRVTHVHPNRPEGLVLDMRISKIPAGDETLQLADDGALFPSIGFMTRGGDQQLDRRQMSRRVNRAFLDHVSMVPTPAYDGARVLSMRDGGTETVSARNLPPLVTPGLDEVMADPIFQWANDHLGRKP